MATLKDKLKNKNGDTEAAKAEGMINDPRSDSDLKEIARMRKELTALEDSPEYQYDRRYRDNIEGKGSPFKGKMDRTDRTTLADAMRKKIQMAEESPGFADRIKSGSTRTTPKPDTTLAEKLSASPTPEVEPEEKRSFTPKIPTTEKAATTQIQAARETGLDLPSDARKGFLDRLDSLREEHRAAADRLGWAEVAETLAHALARYGAARQGLKEGIDLSTGLKFDKTDWESKLNRIQRMYETDLAQIEKEEGRFERGEERKEAKAERDERESTRKSERLEDKTEQEKRDKENRAHREKMAEIQAGLRLKVDALKNKGVDPKLIAHQVQLDQRFKEDNNKIQAILKDLTENLDNDKEWKAFVPKLKGLGYSDDQIAEINKKAMAASWGGDRDVDVIRKVLQNRSASLVANRNKTLAAREDMLKSAPPPPPPSPPEVGTIDAGHRFEGGHPADPNNWKKVK